MSDRPKISVKTGAATRDPRRRPVRGGRSPLPPGPGPDAPPAPRRGKPEGSRPDRPRPDARRGDAPRQGQDPRRGDAPRQGQEARRGDAPRQGQDPRRAEGIRTDRPPADRPPRQHPPTDRPRPAPGRAETRSDRAPQTRTRSASGPGGPAHTAYPPQGAPDGVRLSKILSDRGVASRREADDWIAAGWVRVDGRLAVLGQRIGGHERIDIDPAARREQLQRVTILLHKPIGYVSGQAEDGYEPAAVLVRPENRWSEDRSWPWHPAHGRSLAPAGRLDIDSTGLLVLTQDGRVARHLIGEDSDVEKEYLVRVEPAADAGIADDAIERLRHGLELDGVRLKPAKVSWANEDQLRMVLREGRKRQIRRMCELVGLKVTALKRVRIGQVVLGKLPMGQWRYLRDDERF